MLDRIEHLVRMLPEDKAMIVKETLRGHKMGTVLPSNLTGTECILIMLLEEVIAINREISDRGVE